MLAISTNQSRLFDYADEFMSVAGRYVVLTLPGLSRAVGIIIEGKYFIIAYRRIKCSSFDTDVAVWRCVEPRVVELELTA